MRDPNRIPLVLEKIQEVWALYPDMRFMQLISNIQCKAHNDMFYVEDDKFIETLERIKSEGL